MAGILLEIRKKIGGVKNTRKITKAMQLVAASKMRQFQKKAVSTRTYVHGLLEILERNLKIGELPENLYTRKNEFDQKTKQQLPTLFVIYTSDKGLCGALNTNILRSLVRSEKWQNTPENLRQLIAIGKKSKDFARINNIKVEKSFENLPDKLTSLDSLKIIDAILEYWKKGLVSEIIFLSPHYKNSFTYYPTFKTVLPCSLEMIQTHFEYKETGSEKKKQKFRDYMIYEPSRNRVFEALFEQIIESIFIQSFFELKASEYSSRMIAMQNATDSADRIMKELTQTYNKTRQQVITQELAELIGASEALTLSA